MPNLCPTSLPISLAWSVHQAEDCRVAVLDDAGVLVGQQAEHAHVGEDPERVVDDGVVHVDEPAAADGVATWPCRVAPLAAAGASFTVASVQNVNDEGAERTDADDGADDELSGHGVDTDGNSL